MNTRALTRLAMATAAVMLGHQVAAKALRDAAFLSVWPATALPLMMMASAGLAVAVVPLFARLLTRVRADRVVMYGFVASALMHGLEWRLSIGSAWVVVFLYLHLGGLTAILLSGFWSLVGERFDPRSARQAFGRIAAAGTIGGVLGSVVANRVAALGPVDNLLLLLLVLHLLCAAGVAGIGRTPVLLPHAGAHGTASAWRSLQSSPNTRTIAILMVLTTATAAMLDYLLKWRAADELGTGAALLEFFALFYGAVHVVSFGAQTMTADAVRRFGIGRTITALPAGVGLGSLVTLLVPVWQIVVGLRGLESVLRGSLFRSGYELLFVPMDADERRRVKTFLDVTCDRLGEASGAALVQVLLMAGLAFLTSGILGVVLVLAAASWWVGRRLDRLYLGVVEQQLVRHGDGEPLVLSSEAGWTVVDLSTSGLMTAPAGAATAAQTSAPALDDRMRLVADLRSGDRRLVEGALDRVSVSDRLQVAQVIELLAWDDVLKKARRVLERAAPIHVGMMIDALLNRDTDFALRRRLPRLLATVPTRRSIDGLLQGLDDARFEVRYQCSRALRRMLEHDPALTVDPALIMARVDREVSVPLGVWQGHGLIDQPEVDETAAADEVSAPDQRNIEHVFSLLATILPREPLQVALKGIQAESPGLRGLAVEYLEQVLPHPILGKLRRLVDASTRPTAAAGDVPDRPTHARPNAPSADKAGDNE